MKTEFIIYVFSCNWKKSKEKKKEKGNNIRLRILNEKSNKINNNYFYKQLQMSSYNRIALLIKN